MSNNASQPSVNGFSAAAVGAATPAESTGASVTDEADSGVGMGMTGGG